MKQSLMLVLLLSIYTNAKIISQELITDRPDQTESSSVVPVKHLQIETGAIYEKHKSAQIDFTNITYNTSLLRFGLLETLELRVGLEYLSAESYEKEWDWTTGDNGFGPLQIGFKIFIAGEDGLLPEMAFIGALDLPITANKEFKSDYPAPAMIFCMTHTLSQAVSFGYNFGAEWDGGSASPNYIYSSVIGISINESLGIFVETYGSFNDAQPADNKFDVGATYKLMNNLQLDISSGIGLSSNSPDYFFAGGFSYRLPK